MKKVLIVGYFDLLHSGHIRALQMASGLADSLIVGVNADNVAKTRKGNNRPILSQKERMFVVCNLSCVDKAVGMTDNGEHSAMENDMRYIRAIRPDVFIRNKPDKDMEEFCKGRGIEFVVMAEVLGIDKVHTTDIIDKIKKL